MDIIPAAASLNEIREQRKEYMLGKVSKEDKLKKDLKIRIQNYLAHLEYLISIAISNFCSQASTDISPCLRVFRGSPQHFGDHHMHYGFMKDYKFSHRDKGVFEKCGLEMPFLTLQKKMASAGYYLLDESDSGKSFTMHINLWMIKPNHYKKNHLWHQLNILPGELLQEPNIDQRIKV